MRWREMTFKQRLQWSRTFVPSVSGSSTCRKINRWKGPDIANGNDHFTGRRNLKNANAVSGITIDRSYRFL